MRMILETDRVYLREMTAEDFTDLCDILQDEACMYAYEHAFSDQEAADWLERQLARYRQNGVGLWAVIRKKDREFLGQCGLTVQRTFLPGEWPAYDPHSPYKPSDGEKPEPYRFYPGKGLPVQILVPGEELEIGYLLKRRHWHNGYAREAAAACRDYAFSALRSRRVTSIIRENNLASRMVAERIGLRPDYRIVKHYYGFEMPHIVYAMENVEVKDA